MPAQGQRINTVAKSFITQSVSLYEITRKYFLDALLYDNCLILIISALLRLVIYFSVIFNSSS